MAASVTAKIRFYLDVIDTPAAGLDLASDVGYTHTIEHTLATYDAASTPAATKSFSDTVALSGGAVTLDLSALAGPSSTTVNFNGLKVQIFKMTCPSTNTNPISCTVGVANGYNIFGAADGSVDVMPGATIMIYWDDELDDIVTDTNDEIDFAGTGVETFSIQMVAG